MIFEWDARKAAGNIVKHGVSFPEAATAFGDPLSYTFPDDDHLNQEERFITIGISTAGRILVVVHADRGASIRVISAREATRKERIFYEENR